MLHFAIQNLSVEKMAPFCFDSHRLLAEKIVRIDRKDNAEIHQLYQVNIIILCLLLSISCLGIVFSSRRNNSTPVIYAIIMG